MGTNSFLPLLLCPAVQRVTFLITPLLFTLPCNRILFDGWLSFPGTKMCKRGAPGAEGTQGQGYGATDTPTRAMTQTYNTISV